MPHLANAGTGCRQFGDLGVQPDFQKYFHFHSTQITAISHAVSSLNEGRIAIVTDVGMGCGGRGSVVAQENAGRAFD
jgi:hypothetical protein